MACNLLAMKGDKLERQGGSGCQKRNHEGKQTWGDKAAAADKLGRQGGSGSQERNHERDKLGRQSGSGSQFPQSGTHPLRSKNPYSFAIWGKTLEKVNAFP